MLPVKVLPVVDVVIGNNFGYLPMFVGVDKGFFRKQGLDVRLKAAGDRATTIF